MEIRAKYTILTVILLLTIITSLLLPYLALRYITSTINRSPDYKVKIADVNLSLLQGKAVIVDMRLWKKKLNIPDPIIKINNIEFSVQWYALFKGKLVAKIVLQRPIITIFDIDDNQKNTQTMKISEQSIKIFKSLLPININEIIVQDGTFYFKNNQSKNPFNLYMKKINISIKNIQNIKHQPQELTAILNLNAHVMDSASLSINLKFNPAINTPTFYLKSSLEELSLPQINSFLRKYTDLETKAGIFSFYLEAIAKQGKINGYIKPFLKNLEIKKEKNESLSQKIYEDAVSIAHNILKNPSQETTATKINITGDIDDPDVSILSIIRYLLSHGFIDALLPEIDDRLPRQNIINFKNNQ